MKKVVFLAMLAMFTLVTVSFGQRQKAAKSSAVDCPYKGSCPSPANCPACPYMSNCRQNGNGTCGQAAASHANTQACKARLRQQQAQQKPLQQPTPQQQPLQQAQPQQAVARS